ncbi:PREDICTED: WPP domain-associated protein-like [Prunus mume]|uniref:WPP domain-associated protein-like n=1 Tax=Prunus mume TaxID=102107 RepID=A0ABM1LSR1_PRUMU|nr:PREDICTED: WPP domain-associated protein-like [Prunus mume]
MSNGVQSCNGGLQLSNDVKENDNGDVDLVEEFDSYWQDISYRLTVSRVVSDTVIKGMVQEAAEKIAEKELEVTKLKEMLNVYHVGVENEFLASLAMRQESNRLIKQGTKDKMHPSSLEAILEYDRIEQSLSSLRGATKEEFKKLEAEIDSIRGSSVKIISELLGLSDIQQDKVSDRWGIGVDRTLNCLKNAIETGFQRVEQMVRLSKADVHEWQQEQEFKAEIEAFVMRNGIWRFEEKIWDQFYSDKNVNGHGRMKERISGLRQELDAISKSLSVSDFGQLSSHGSLEGDEESNNFKKGDHPHRKVLNDLKSSSPSPATSPPTSTSSASSSASSWEKNGTQDKSEINMSIEELINYYNTEMTELKRNHESKVQDMTEQLFSHMRELLKERGSSLPSKKNKEFDMLRRRISEVISKLDDILVENEQKATFGIDEESLSRLKDGLESLLSENAQLRDLLTDKKREIKCLSLQVSEAAEKMSEHNGESSEAKERLEQDAAAALEKEKERYELAAQELENLRGQLRDLLTDKKREIKCLSLQVSEAAEKMSEHNELENLRGEIEDLNMESIIMQELVVVIFRDLKDAEQKLDNLNMTYTSEKGLRVSFEMENLEKGKQLEVEVASKEKLNQKIIFLEEAKERLEEDAAAALEKEKKRYEFAAQELENLRGESNAHKAYICELGQRLLDVNQEKQNVVSLFERRVTRDISGKSSRLKSLRSQLHSLKQKAKVLVKRKILYKRGFERKCSDLEKAEAEVDLLGKEVDTLSSLVEKIYMALDHYSPILQHYAGISEILKLIRRKLRGETKAV